MLGSQSTCLLTYFQLRSSGNKLPTQAGLLLTLMLNIVLGVLLSKVGFLPRPCVVTAQQADNTSTRVPGGESLDELRERLTAAVLDIARTHAGEPGVRG